MPDFPQRRNRTGLAASLVLGLTAAIGCSIALDKTRLQCSVAADCRARGAGFSDSVCIDSLCVDKHSPDAPMSANDSGAGGDAAPAGRGTGGKDPADGGNADSTADGGPTPADGMTDGGAEAPAKDAGEPSVEPPPDKPTEPDGGSLTPSVECTADDECPGVELCQAQMCIDPFECELPPVPEPGMSAIRVPVVDVFQAPMANIPVKACLSLDTQCTTPLASGNTDESGVLSLTLTSHFTGYLEFQVPGFFPTLEFLPEDLPDGTTLAPVSLSPVQVIDGLAQAVGGAVDPERGHLHVQIANCLGGAEGVALRTKAADDNTIGYYTTAGIPSADTAETSDGGAGFLNLPVGTAVVTVVDAATERRFGQYGFVVRAGFISSATLRPIHAN